MAERTGPGSLQSVSWASSRAREFIRDCLAVSSPSFFESIAAISRRNSLIREESASCSDVRESGFDIVGGNIVTSAIRTLPVRCNSNLQSASTIGIATHLQRQSKPGLFLAPVARFVTGGSSNEKTFPFKSR